MSIGIPAEQRSGPGGISSFRPGLWPSLIAGLGVALLVGLGIWQLDRLSWKEALLAEIEAGLAAPAVTLPADIAGPLAYRYRRVVAHGRYLHDAEIHLFAVRDGMPGYDVVTPLVRTEGAAVLVDRGWVPETLKDRALRPETVSAGIAKVEGTVRLGDRRGSFTPENEPDRNIWFWRDIDAMAAQISMPVLPVVVERISSDGDEFRLPLPRRPEIEIPNRHLGYALTWFGLALALVAVYVFSQRRPRSDSTPPRRG